MKEGTVQRKLEEYDIGTNKACGKKKKTINTLEQIEMTPD